MNLNRYIGVIGIHTAMGRFLGYVRDTLLVSVLGASGIADALFLATKLASLFRRLFTEGAFNASFIPIFGSLKAKKGDLKAIHFAEQSIVWMSIIIGLITLGVIFWSEEFVGLIAAGYKDDPNKLQWTREFTEIVFPYILLICITAVVGASLNAIHSFVQTAASQTVGNISIILLFLLMKDWLSTPAHAAAWAILLSAIVQLLWLYIIALRAGLVLRPRWPRLTSPLREFMMRLLPGILGTGIVQINVLISIFFGSYLSDGGVSYLQITERINQFPLSIIGVALGMVLIPMLTAEFHSGNIKQALKTQNKAIESSLELSLPICIFVMMFAALLVSALFMHGRFNASDVLASAPCLIGFISGLPAYVLLKVFSSVFFAVKDTLRPSIAGGIAMAINGILCCLVVNNHFLNFFPSHVGIAYALSISGWINLLILAFWAYARNLFYISRKLLLAVFRIIVLSTVMLLALHITKPHVDLFIFHATKVTQLITLLGIVVLSISVYLTSKFLYQRIIKVLK